MICLEHPELALSLNSFKGGGWIGLLEAEEQFGRGIGGKSLRVELLRDPLLVSHLSCYIRLNELFRDSEFCSIFTMARVIRPQHKRNFKEPL